MLGLQQNGGSISASTLSPADALVVDQYRRKQHWVEFNDDLLNDTAQGMDLVERSEAWSRVNKLFRNLENDDQCALQMVVIDGTSLRQTGRLLGVSAMTVQRRVKRGLNTIAMLSLRPEHRDPSVPEEF